MISRRKKKLFILHFVKKENSIFLIWSPGWVKIVQLEVLLSNATSFGVNQVKTFRICRLCAR